MTASLAYDSTNPRSFNVAGNVRQTFITITLATNDYVTGGIDFSSYVPGTFLGAHVVANTGAGSLTQIPAVDRTNKKLVLVKGTAGANAEVSNGSSDAQVVSLILLSF